MCASWIRGEAARFRLFQSPIKDPRQDFLEVPCCRRQGIFSSKPSRQPWHGGIGSSKRTGKASAPFSARRIRCRALSSISLPAGRDASLPGKAAEAEKPSRWLSAQFLSLGVEKRKAEILAALQEVYAPDGITERSDAPVRALEGLEPSLGILAGSVPDSILMEENGATFSVDLAGGQKTGWFLDQRANRAAAARAASGKDVLDVFSNQGGFGILCALSGAASVVAVDSSAEALAAAARNAAINNVADRFSTIEANAFDSLRSLEKEGKKFDLSCLIRRLSRKAARLWNRPIGDTRKST